MEPTISYQNIPGTLYAEDGGLAFYANGKAIWATPLENIINYAWAWTRWYNDPTHKFKNLVTEAITLGLISINRYAYVWIEYYEEEVGKAITVRFLVSDFWINQEESVRLMHNIGNEIADYRNTIRHAIHPQKRSKTK